MYPIHFLASTEPGLPKTLGQEPQGGSDARATTLSFPLYDSIHPMGI